MIRKPGISGLHLRRGDRIVLALLAIAIALSLFYSLSLFWQPAESIRAQISRNGELLQSIRLDRVEESYDLLFTGGANDEYYNKVRVEPGRIRVIEANCPQQVDVRAGWLSVPGQSAICIPHRFVIVIESDASDDIDTWIR